ncbi:carbon-nitrogen hydrolase family protein [Anaeromicropila herbilytica]|uniref:Carbon-nitrogen hydrolase n=1 Tax=Anaeromicropila herbilytica TaxID=2785025 RepID=A0A7R7ELK1_9FIRM|nr:nitrilase-related carbon-nitrogen hydrolase [Anaeromicropila herbilytica]BCN30988.1 carbon-nitrogen hydrolase [Anaeromicropila herbilytica]
MKIGLVSYEFINNDIAFNISQMEKAMRSVQGKVNLLCFGETFLQGFDALNWNYENDKHVAISVDSEIMQQLCNMTLRYKVDILFGYIEKCEDSLYSTCAVIESGKLIHNYRRISKGWKKYWLTDSHYKEGSDTSEFLYHGHSVMIALCGDIWDYPERFKTNNLLIWPVYVNFTLVEWPQYEIEYAEQAYLAANQTLMINSISENPKCYGGAFNFVDGKIKEKLEHGIENILIVEV